MTPLTVRNWYVSGVAQMAFASLLMCSMVLRCARALDLLVGNVNANSISRFDGSTGAFLGDFVAQGAGGLNGTSFFVFGPDRNLYVSSIHPIPSGSVKRYSGTSGAYIDDFVPAGSGGGIEPYGLAFGPDGNLYVASGGDIPGGGKVSRFNGTTGVYIDTFVPNGSGGLNYAQGIVFGSDGNLYVAKADSPQAILRYNGTTGAFMDIFVSIGSGDPSGVKFGPDGNLYVALFYGQVIKRYDGKTGADMGTIPLSWPADIAFGPDGNLYATSRYASSVERFNGTTGTDMGTFATGSEGEVFAAQWFPSADTTPPLVSNVQVTPDPVAINTPSTLTATIDDSTTGGSNIASAQYNINGGQFFPMQAADGDFNQVTENVTVIVPAFAATGVYNLCVTGTDSAGNTSGPSCIPLPVYDPTGGFVTGGGSILSSAGKDLVNTSAAGEATFGFVSKYLKGSNTPSGNLEFHFQAGNLHFQSTSMDWLVVTGQPRAQFHGTGTINGANICQFAVDAWAGSFPSTNGPVDAFGIKIYSCNSGGDSNGNRYSIDATPLSGGRIIVHQ